MNLSPFFRAMLRSPDDPAPRLALADELLARDLRLVSDHVRRTPLVRETVRLLMGGHPAVLWRVMNGEEPLPLIFITTPEGDVL